MAAGDLLICHICCGAFVTASSNTITPPAGWAQLQNISPLNTAGNGAVALFWKRAFVGDPSSFVFSIGGGESCRWAALMQAIQNAGDPQSSAQYWDPSPVFDNSTECPAVTTTIANSVDFRFPARYTNQQFSGSPPWSDYRPDCTTHNHTIASFWQTRATPGTYGVYTATCTTAVSHVDGGTSLVIPPDGGTPSVRSSSEAFQDASETASLTIGAPSGVVGAPIFIPQIIMS